MSKYPEIGQTVFLSYYDQEKGKQIDRKVKTVSRQSGKICFKEVSRKKLIILNEEDCLFGKGCFESKEAFLSRYPRLGECLFLAYPNKSEKLVFATVRLTAKRLYYFYFKEIKSGKTIRLEKSDCLWGKCCFVDQADYQAFLLREAITEKLPSLYLTQLVKLYQQINIFLADIN